MTIRIKVLLIIIPPIFLGILFIGFWSTKIFTQHIFKNNNEVSILYLDKIINQHLRKRTDLLTATGLENTKSYISYYQKEALENFHKESTTYSRNIYIIKKNAEVISKIKPPKEISLSLWKDVIKKVKLNIGFTEGYIPLNDTGLFYVAKYFKPWDWIVVVSISEKELLSIVYDIKKTIFIISLILALLVGLLVYIISFKLLVIPISKLEEASVLFAKNKQLKKINITSKDEFFNLARSMENMYLSIIKKTKALQKNEEIYRGLFENSEVSIWNEDLTEVFKSLEELRKVGVTDIRKHLTQNIKLAQEISKKVKVVDVNSATLRLFNANSKDDFLSGIDVTFGDDTILVFIDILNAIWENKESFTKEAFFKTFDGKTICGIVTFQIPKNIENFENVSVNIIDITNLKKAEKELKSTNTLLEQKKNELETIIQEAPNPIMLHNEDGKVLMVNKVWKELTGYEYKDIDTIEKWTYLAYGEKMPVIKEYIDNLYNLSHKVDEGQYDIITKDGNIINWQFGSAPLGLIDGRRTVISSAMDITELKQKDVMLINQSRHAAMGEMIGMIAHQWRQPISVISMDANNMLLDIGLEDFNITEAERYAKSITKQTQHLSETIDDFRNFFKPDKIILEINIKEVLDSTFPIVKDSLINNNIELTTSFETDREVKAYPRELMQVFVNIINNAKDALKSNNQNNASISIRVYEDEKYVNTEICDNGGGIDIDVLPKVFDPYFSTKDEKTGTGLGLYMSKMIVEEHLNGFIEAYNTDKGACFNIGLLKEHTENG